MGRGLETLERALAAPVPVGGAATGSVVVDSILGEYCDLLAERFRGEALGPRSVVIDCANGVGALPLGVLERLGVRHTLLYHVPDGAFPNHGPDTLRPENLAALRAAVPATRADLGVMFDGDADRVAFVDERGAIVPPEGSLLVLAREELARRHAGDHTRGQSLLRITVEYPDWWFNLRASHTEPVAKLVIEAASPAALAARREEVQRTLGVSLP